MADIFIANKDLFRAPWPENERNRWPEAYTARFEECGDRGFLATKEQGPDQFAWAGVPGICYRCNAFLPSWTWRESASSRFASWKCAVFAPVEVDKGKPVVFLFTGIGGDYSACAWPIPYIVQQMGCICVVFETHLTGTRGLREWYASLDRNVAAYNSDFGYEAFGSKAFANITSELSFNTRQVMEMVARQHGLTHRRFITCGFSLGAHYAYQIALSQPTCIGAVGGCGSAIITDYFSSVPRADYPRFERFIPPLPILEKWREIASLYSSIFRVEYSGYALDNAFPGQDYYFLLGDMDTFTCALTEARVRTELYGGQLCKRGANYHVKTYHSDHCPFQNPGMIERHEDCVGTGMLDSLRELTR